MVTNKLPLPGSYRVEEYVREDGSIPYRLWFDGLDSQAAAKVAVALVRLSLGNTSRVKWFSGIGEYVINWGPGYRVYLARDGGSLIVLFGGGTKARQQADIERATILHTEYKSRKAAGARVTKSVASSAPNTSRPRPKE
jgi:putative addiction module killer protein